ncbi:RNA polymerase sigma factor, sigma-70 family [Longilinea arvoryzae]|uniref:RNA polymerase sigma factor, sigma-70 family n=1 Tax=Longilinea arvoryzae TaxID=360412 RepID=A0A0K8MYB8_9CHLR|nr:sigma-70 family RNA polymerase sigma factor [Longilinea arvoryzae]GAP16036.1 RNA polymerase sigma factor, sigma-70 family [Longilinea arvoryzae]
MAESDMALGTRTLPGEPDDGELIAAARRDPHQFGALYQRYANPVFRYLYSRNGDIHEAEDLTAQTFLAAFETFERFRGDGHFAAWLFGIARNKAVDAYRVRRTDLALDEAVGTDGEADPLAGAIRTEQSAALAGLIRALDPEEQEILRLRYLGELSFREMGSLLGRSEDAIKKTTYRLLARLHSQVEQSDE